MTTVTPFLMFQGDCEQALNLYVSLLPDARIDNLVRWGPDGQAPEGQVQQATFTLAGTTFRAFDSPPVHAFTFTPSISFFVECESEAELREVGDALAEGGAVMMPADNYGFSQLFTWVEDRFGVAWQLNLA